MQPSQVELVVKSSSATSRRRSSTSWEAEKARLRRCRTAAVLAVTVLAGLAALLVPLGYWASHRTTQHVPLGSSGLGVSPTVLATLRDDWKEEGTPDPTAIMRLTISIAPKQDLEATHELLSNISTPGHPMHRQFLSASELRALVANDAGAAQVRAWLEGGGATIVFVGAHGLHFEVEAPVKVWERLLKVSFIRLVYIGSSSSAARRRRLQASQSAPTLIMRPIHRARGRPHVPEALAGSVRAIHGLSSLPPRLHAEGPLRRPLVQADENPTEASATPASETPVGVAERRRLGGAPWINAEGCSVDPCEASEGGARRLQAWQGDPEGAKASHICCAPATEGARRMQASEGGARRLQAWQGDPEGRQACTDDAVEAGRRLMQGVQATPLADAAGLHGICVNGSALNSTTIGLMRKTYQIPDGAGNDAVVQYLLTPLPKPHSPSDLRAFQVLYGLNETNVSSHCLGVYGKCEDDSAYGALEANLDAQYLSAVAPNAQVVEQYFDVWDDDGCHGPHCWLGNLAQCANDDCASSSCSFDPCFGKPPPSVVSISWGVPEIDLTEGDVHTFNQNAAYLALLGVTIVVAAGDGGAAGMFHPPTDDDSQPVHAPVCGSTYQALFPASSPYVTAVGATQGIESAQEEAGCSAGSGGGITSGGGFSLTKYSKKTTPWQVSHVTDYLRTPQGAQAQQGYFEHVSYSYDTDNSEYASSGRIATHRACAWAGLDPSASGPLGFCLAPVCRAALARSLGGPRR